MSRHRVPVPVPNRHVDANFPSDWMTVLANGEVVVIHEPGDCGTTAYTIDHATENPRALAAADAIMWKGNIAHTFYEDGSLLVQHPYAGRLDWLPINEFLDEPVPRLSRTELVRLKGVGGRVEFECVDCGDHVDRERNQMDIPGLTPRRCVSCTFDRMGGEA